MSDEQLVVRPQTAIEQTCQKTLLEVLNRYKKSIDAMLPKMIEPRRFAYLAITAVRSNPRLAECSPASFINSVMLATQMGLEIRRDSAYLVPFGRECQLLIDYKGKLGLARRGGKVGAIQAVTVRYLDGFEWVYSINGVKFSHEPFKNGIRSPEERGQIVGVYAFAHLADGSVQFREPMSLSEIDRIRKRSRAGVSSMNLEQIFAAHELTEDGKQAVWQSWQYKDPRRQPWVTDFEAMALKSVLHSLCKSLPLVPEAQLSQEVDEGFETGKQPNILADAVDIDPIDQQSMVEASAEEQDRVLAEKLGAAKVENDRKRDDKAAAAAQRKAQRAAPVPDVDELPDPVFEGLPSGTQRYCKGVLYEVAKDTPTWKTVQQQTIS